MAVTPLHRRDFLAALASIPWLPYAARAATPYAVHFRKPPPHQSALAFIAPGHDEFTQEQQALYIETTLKAMLDAGSLPPLASLGPIRRASFFALPENRVRYEIASQGAYRVGEWKTVWKDGKLAELTQLHETVATSPAPLFSDVTGHCFREAASFRDQLLKGNTWWRSRLDAASGIDVYGSNGIAVADIDNDGVDEIYVCQPGGLPNRLYKNRGDGTLIDISAASGLDILDDTSCALFADFRNSGRQDAVVLRSSGPLLFLNRGDGTFSLAPDAFRFRTPAQGSFTGMAAADYDHDGRVDLYLCCYIYFQSEDQYRYPVPYHDARNGPPNFLFHNRLTSDGGHFQDVTQETGLDQNNDRYSFAPAWCDFDGDGWPDLYVANDFGRSNLYKNSGGKFRDQAAEAGVENVGPAMSAAWFDYDGDGRPDLYVSNMWTAAGQRIVNDPAFQPAREHPAEYRSHTQGNSLYRNLGDGKFKETGQAQGVAMGRWAWCADAFDFDNDGAVEILGAAGMLTNPSPQDLESFFWRQVVSKSGANYENGWNALNQLIREDYSWSGRQPNVFYKRPPGATRFVDFSGVSGLDVAEDTRAFAVTDIDGDGNLDIVLKNRLGPQVRIFQNRSAEGRKAIAIRLRGVQSNRDAIGARVECNGAVQFLKAGSGYLSQHSKQLHFGLGNAAEAWVKILWPSGLKQEFAHLKVGFVYSIEEGSTSPNAAPFRTFQTLPSSNVSGENLPAFESTWLVEPVPLPDQRRGPGFVLLTDGRTPALSGVPLDVIDVTQSPPEVAAWYAILRRYLFDLRADLELPLLWLIDARGLAHKFYSTVPSKAQLTADLQALASGAGAKQALPFPGRYYSPPRRSYFKLGAAFYWAGYPDQAIPYLEETVRRTPGNWKALLAIARIQLDAERLKPALERFNDVLAIRPDHAPALLGAGETYAKLDDLPAAERLLRRALEADPKNSDAMNQLGLVYARQNRAPEAKELFERAISITRDHSGAINNLAVLYMKSGQPNDALAAFQYGIEVAPDDETLYLNLGRLLVSLGQRDKARDVMRRLLDRKPGDPVATRALHELDSR